MNVATVMDQLATQLDTIAGLRVYAYPPDSIPVPAAVVAFPVGLNFDLTYQRGGDRMTLPVTVLVGKVSERTARDRLGAYMNGSGASSFKQVLEAGTYTAFGSLRVMSCEVSVMTVGAVEYLAGTFQVDVIGLGA